MSKLSKHKFSPALMTQIAVVAAVYAALTVLLTPFSYGALQVRIAEALMLLCIYRKRWCVSLTLGCLIANLFSGMPVDVLFGTLATVVAAVLMYRIRKPFLASLIPALANGVIVGAELHFFYEMPYLLTFLGVAVGELISVTLIGLPVMTAAMRSAAVRKLVCGDGRVKT